MSDSVDLRKKVVGFIERTKKKKWRKKNVYYSQIPAKVE